MLLSLIEASRRFRVSYWKLSRMVMSDILPAVSVDGFLMVREEDVRACTSCPEAGESEGRPAVSSGRKRRSGCDRDGSRA